MERQFYTAYFAGKQGTMFWGSRNERVRAVRLTNVCDCKGRLLFEDNRTKLTDTWARMSLKAGDIVQFKAERYGNRLMAITNIKVIGHI